jgi:hypothetical protein
MDRRFLLVANMAIFLSLNVLHIYVITSANLETIYLNLSTYFRKYFYTSFGI